MSTETRPARRPAGLGVLSTETPPRKQISPAPAAETLADCDPVVARLHALYGPPQLKNPTTTPFASLVCSITHQQIATSAATAISGRLDQLLHTVTPERVLEVSPDELRTVGPSWSHPSATWPRSPTTTWSSWIPKSCAS
ncbi:hypothetical protein ABZV67_33545 [Streptomyces sp. NPDC005065]|uniref:hypothetical protein n=1 Tax=Streptomyces sp. NPDC005065 TaxID=3154461 RepID=UPI0033BBB812